MNLIYRAESVVNKVAQLSSLPLAACYAAFRYGSTHLPTGQNFVDYNRSDARYRRSENSLDRKSDGDLSLCICQLLAYL